MPSYIFVEDGVVVRTHESTEAFDPMPAGAVQVASPPPDIIGQKYLGLDEDGNATTEPVPVPDPKDDPRFWCVDVGPFYTRFGMDSIAIAASDAGPCKAVDKLCAVRKYIDLKDPTVGAMISMLIGQGLPAAVDYAPGSGPMTLEKKDKILNTPTTEYERHFKGVFRE